MLSGTNQIFIGANNKTTNISGSAINISGSVNINTTGSATTTIGNGPVNINTSGAGNTTIGNVTGSGYTDIQSNCISIGKNLTGAGYIDIGGLSNTTTGYIVVGSPNLNEAIIKAKTIMINHDTTGSVYIGRDNLGRVELRGSIVVLNGQGGDLNLGGVSSGTINLYRPLTVVYTPPSLTSFNQIGYTSSTSYGGSYVNGTNQVNRISSTTLAGVWMIKAIGNLYATGAFNGISAYNFEIGYYGGQISSRNYVSGSSFTYNNTWQTLCMVYTSSGSVNVTGLDFYSAISLSCGSVSGSSTWAMEVSYTRIA